MRSIRFALVACLALGALACGDDDTPTPDAPTGGGPDAPVGVQVDATPSSVTISACTGLTPAATITTTGIAFTNPDPTIAVGDVVRFAPGTGHNMVADDDSWSSGATGVESCGTFNEAGAFPYHCVVHPVAMTGTITVQ